MKDAVHAANERGAQDTEMLRGQHEEPANLTIKVTKRQRLHWLIEAKKQGTSLTAAITEALNARFGTPQ